MFISLSYLNRCKLMEQVNRQVDVSILMRMEAHTSWDEIVGYFIRLAECIFDNRSSESFSNVNRIFGFIRNHVEQHLDGDLSLTRLADLLHFNPSYLSRLFKQVTGKGLNEYIAEMKLKKARELLADKDMKISDIAMALGFETPSYFTRFFRKLTNMSPQEYRDTSVAESLSPKV